MFTSQFQLGRRTVHRAFLMYPESYCRADLNGDFIVDVQDLLILLANWGVYSGGDCFSPDFRGTGSNPPDGVVDVLDLIFLLGEWGPCPAIDVTVLTLSEELTEAGLTQQQWTDDYNTMTGGASQSVKVNWTCWMENYLSQCTSCPECPDDDPFAE
ncbi:MAG TPA: GC-type dockerin domain-anchored protein [Phycisphaerales bacterium]|nr:GC-type dockerin domain-anchored protein [Phycisphaerales bacterium]